MFCLSVNYVRFRIDICPVYCVKNRTNFEEYSYRHIDCVDIEVNGYFRLSWELELKAMRLNISRIRERTRLP